jgi:hypothetical protein
MRKMAIILLIYLALAKEDHAPMSRKEKGATRFISPCRISGIAR